MWLTEISAVLPLTNHIVWSQLRQMWRCEITELSTVKNKIMFEHNSFITFVFMESPERLHVFPYISMVGLHKFELA